MLIVNYVKLITINVLNVILILVYIVNHTESHHSVNVKMVMLKLKESVNNVLTNV